MVQLAILCVTMFEYIKNWKVRGSLRATGHGGTYGVTKDTILFLIYHTALVNIYTTIGIIQI